MLINDSPLLDWAHHTPKHSPTVFLGRAAREPEHRKNDMEDTKSEDKPKGSNRGAPELGTVTIEFNPGPDAQDRLRRLFTLLVEYATRDKVPPSEADLSLGDGSEDEG